MRNVRLAKTLSQIYDDDDLDAVVVGVQQQSV